MLCRGYNIGAHWPSGTASNNAQGAPKQVSACEADGSSGNNVEEEQEAFPSVAVVPQDDSQAQQENEAGSSDVEQPASEAEAIASCCSPKTNDASGCLDDAGFR